MRPDTFGKIGKGKQSLLLSLVFVAALGGALYFMGTVPATDLAATAAESAATAEPGSGDSDGYLVKDYAELENPVSAQSDGWWRDGIDVLAKLLVVLGVLYLSLRALRYLNRKSRATGTLDSPIKMLHSTTLAQHQNLYLVEIAGRVLLLGGTSNQLGLLTEISDPEGLALLQASSVPAAPGMSFSGYLERLLKSSRTEPAPEPVKVPADSLVQAVESCRAKLSRTRAELRSTFSR